MSKSNRPSNPDALQLPLFGLLLPNGLGPFLLPFDDYQLGAVPIFSDLFHMVEFLGIAHVGSSRKIYAISSKADLQTYLVDSVGASGWAILNPELNNDGKLVGKYITVLEVINNTIEMSDLGSGSGEV